MREIISENKREEVIKFSPTDFANFFNIGQNGKQYEFIFNKTLHIDNIDNMSSDLYTLYTIRYKDNWPIISYKVYGYTSLWWVIMKANNFNDATKLPEVGTNIKILKIEVVENILQSLRQRGK